MADARRSDRVAEAIRTEVATFLRAGAKDPRLRGLVTVTAVDVTRDLRNARVFVSVMGNDEEKAATYEGLNSVAAHLRSHLGKVLRLRAAPEIRFEHDQSIERAARIEALLAQVRTGDADAAAPSSADAADVAAADAPDAAGNDRPSGTGDAADS